MVAGARRGLVAAQQALVEEVRVALEEEEEYVVCR